MSNFDGWDYAVLITILLISALIGLYYRYTGGRQKTTNEYLMGNHSMSVMPVSFGLMASFMSAISLMGVSNESYQFGTMFCIINFAYVLSTPIAAYLFLPVFYRMRSTSVYEYLERRFGHSTRLAASLAFSVQMILYMGIVLYAPALALEALTGISKVTAILVIGLVCTFYSTIGGMKAVLITDVFQSLLMYAAIFCVIVVSAIKAGGLSTIWQVANERGRLYFTDFSIDPTVRHTWWSLIIGGMVTYISLYGVNQTQVQRLVSVKNLKGAQSALWWTLPILMLLSFSTIFSGLAIFYYYRDCDPLLEGRIQSRDQLMPLFAFDTMGQYPGLCGLFVSGIFSASLSTISSAVNSLAAVTLEDYIKPIYKRCFNRPMDAAATVVPSKVMAGIYGIVCIALAFIADSMGGVLQSSLTIFGIVGGPLLALFTLGMFTVKSNQRGVLVGLFIGLTFSFIIGFGGTRPPTPTLELRMDGCPADNATTLTTEAITEIITTTTTMKAPIVQEYYWFNHLSYLWFSVLGFIVTLISGYMFSVLLERYNLADNKQMYLDDECKRIDTDLFVPPLSRKLKERMGEESTKLNNYDASAKAVC